MKIILTKVGTLLVPLVVVVARLVLNEGLTELEKALQTLARQAAARYLQAHPA